METKGYTRRGGGWKIQYTVGVWCIYLYIFVCCVSVSTIGKNLWTGNNYFSSLYVGLVFFKNTKNEKKKTIKSVKEMKMGDKNGWETVWPKPSFLLFTWRTFFFREQRKRKRSSILLGWMNCIIRETLVG